MAGVPPPVTLPPRLPPDRDFDDLRATAVAVVAADSGPTWTDHNFSDPGITFLEVLAWSLADLHYRTAGRGFELAALEAPLWLDRSERDWFGMPDLGDPERVVALARLLATRVPAVSGPPELDRMAGIVSAASSRRMAIGALADRPFGSPPRPLAWDEAGVVVSLLRGPRLRRAALDASDTLAAAWTEARRTIERRALGGPVDEGDVDDEVVRLLGFERRLGGLWEDELRTLIRRHRHRIFLERVAAFMPALDPSAQPTITSVQAALGITGDEARAVLALHPCPLGALPELWEAADGATTTWPPHPLQALVTEPVTAEDYATRARGAPRVRRAWTVPGALAGIAWDGSVRDQPATGPSLGAVTVLVELDQVPGSVDQRRAWMRDVLAFITAGAGEVPELQLPFDTLTTPNLQVPRRVMCDELGVATVQQCAVTLNGVLHVALGADRTRVLDGALARVRAWFAAGRPETAAAIAPAVACPPAIDGPWPPVPQPAGGWTPCEAIRLHELVQVLADDPTVIGVEGVEAQIDGEWHAIAIGKIEAPLAPDCVPALAETQCLKVRLELGADCHG
jgi:hypothetical protein